MPARELLPERALLGDPSAIAALHNDVMRPLADAGPALTETLDAYLDSGGAIEACARKLFVHPNTVRYRLKRIADFTGRDPTMPRDAYVLRVATTVGRLAYQQYHSSTSNGSMGHVTSGPGRRRRRHTRGVRCCISVSAMSHHVRFCGISTKT